MRYFRILLIVYGISFVFCTKTVAQKDFRDSIPPYIINDEDTIKTMVLNAIYIYPPQTFKSKGQEEQYRKLIRDIKKTLPYAKLIYNTLIETYEYMMTLPDDKAKEEHLKRMEKELFIEYKPVLKKMTLSQGKLLIRLIDRECHQNSYTILKAFLGPFRAGFWNLFAGIFGASLKSEWEPNGKDAAAERIIQMVEMGLL
ncbi:MAG: DUF4294 domain-containing protein [Dysgonamonadaceae bacterium]|jgi:hypothetical protein|nr:DUF4294 domain-containing protein [Dysgonamonadaceae bacterium]